MFNVSFFGLSTVFPLNTTATFYVMKLVLYNNEFVVPPQVLLSRSITYYVVVAVDRPMFTIVYILHLYRLRLKIKPN